MNSNSSPLETPDLLRLILELLPPADLARAACVCKLWKDLASDRDLLERAFRNPWKLQRVLGFPSTEGFWRHTGLDRFAISHCLIPGDTIVGLAVKYSVQRFFKMGIFQLFIAASVPVIKVLIVTGVGAFIATDYIGVLGEDARKHLNNVVFYVFNPALVATNLSKTVTLESVVLLWFMPINILLTFLIGSAFGWVIIKITKAPHQIRGLILGCCSAGNLGNLLLITVPATCKEKGSPFGAPDVCTKYGLAYCSLSMAIGAVFLWSYVYNIVRISSRKPEEKPKANDQVPKLECTVESTYMKDVETSSALVNYKDGCEITQPLFAGSSAEKKVSFLQKMQSVINFRNLFAPSTIGVIIGFTIGVITPIRKTLIGESAPLRVIQDSASLVSDGAIPSLTLILGGNLLKGFRGSSIRAPVVIGVIFVRYLLLPLVGIAIVKGAVLLGLVHVDPLYQFVLLVQYALPPAMNIGTITQLFGAGESECSVLFFWTYVLASVSLTLWSTYFMWLVS